MGFVSFRISDRVCVRVGLSDNETSPSEDQGVLLNSDILSGVSFSLSLSDRDDSSSSVSAINHYGRWGNLPL